MIWEMKNCVRFGEKLIETINRDSSGDDNKIFIDCAIGISCCVNVANVKLRSVLMKRADLALFAAKEKWRAKYCCLG